MDNLLKAGLESLLNVNIVGETNNQNQNNNNNNNEPLINYINYSELIHGVSSSDKVKSGYILPSNSVGNVNLNIYIRSFVGKYYQVNVNSKMNILEFKKYLHSNYEKQIKSNKMVLVYGTKVLDNNYTIGDYSIRDESTINIFITEDKIKLDNVFDHIYNFDFTNIRDIPNSYFRGEHVYNRPCGSKRYALYVLNRFDNNNNNWLGEDKSSWPVSYHSSLSYIDIKKNILSNYPTINLQNNEVLTTPSFELAKMTANIFNYNGLKYYLIFQNRINPKSITTIQINGRDVYWKSLSTFDHIRPYSICIGLYN